MDWSKWFLEMKQKMVLSNNANVHWYIDLDELYYYFKARMIEEQKGEKK